MAYTALPLVLSALDIKLSSITYQITPKMGFNPLEAYSKMMKCFQDQFDGTEEVSAIMDHILSEAEPHLRKLCMQITPARFPSSRNNNNDWYEIFLRHPKLHLRVAMTFDLSFSRGRFPEDEDFPRQLRADRLDDQMMQHIVSVKETSPRKANFHDDDELVSAVLQATSSSAENFLLPPELLPARTDLDFLDLFAEDDASRNVSSAADCDEFMDAFLDIGDHGGGEQDWEQTVMDLFEQPIPG
jgi:hypothetical protein